MGGVVLLVDDDFREAELIRHAAISAGVAPDDFLTATTVHDALGYLLSFRSFGHYSPRLPRLVLLDLKLAQGASGLELVRAMRDLPVGQHMPVVMLTNSNVRADVVESYADGANAYLVKPLELDALRAVVGQTVRFWLGRNQLPPGGSRPASRAQVP